MKAKLLLLTCFVLLVSACGSQDNAKSYPEGTIAAHLAEDGRFTTFLEITDEVILESAPPLLVNPEYYPLTIFAPTDEAFAALPPDLVKQLKNDPGIAQELLFHHGFDRALFSKDFGALKTWPTIITPVNVSFEIDGDQIRYDGALVIEKDIQVGDSVVHVIDSVTGIDLLTD
jgi:uncharacterized surface protein with fasciclin (FAS1) repeats